MLSSKIPRRGISFGTSRLKSRILVIQIPTKSQPTILLGVYKCLLVPSTCVDKYIGYRTRLQVTVNSDFKNSHKMSKTYFITGANRGIGLGLTKQALLEKDSFVIATTRNIEKSTDLQKLANDTKRVKIIELDVSSLESVKTIDESLKGIEKIDILIHNAGIAKDGNSLLKTSVDSYQEHFNVNVVGPISVFQNIYKYFKNSSIKKLIFISSLAGSIGAGLPMESSSYGTSKAALNYVQKEISMELAGEGFFSLSVHPGLVDTEMATPSIEKFTQAGLIEESNGKRQLSFSGQKIDVLTPDESASEIFEVLSKLGDETNGKFLSYDGTELPY